MQENYCQEINDQRNAEEQSAYASLPVSDDLKDLFKLIKRYQPRQQQLEVSIKPFIGDYIPAPGECDAFLKIPRPDQVTETLGLYVLDEPALNQSVNPNKDIDEQPVYEEEDLQKKQMPVSNSKMRSLGLIALGFFLGVSVTLLIKK